jgi:photosystem II stability/assembly factor-like uncharacterized protein
LGGAWDGSDTRGQGWYDLCLAVSPTDVNQIFIGGINTWKSTNGGVNWSIMTHWWWEKSPTVPVMHADHHDLVFQNNSTLWSANDGGIYRSTNNGVSWTDLSNGMVISQIYRVGVSQQDSKIITGLQDNGTKVRRPTGSWTDYIGGDGMDCAIDPVDKTVMYGTIQNGKLFKTTDDGASFNWTDITPSTGSGAWISPFLIDPVNPATIYFGKKELFKSNNRGTSWSQITNNQTGGNNIDQIAVAPSNPQVIFFSFSTSLWKTINGGTSWVSITPPQPSLFITSILIDSNNESLIFLSELGLI